MKHRVPPWLLLLVVVVVCLLVMGGVAYFRRAAYRNEALVPRLPGEGAVLLSIDFDALRRSGLLKLLSASKVAEEPEYRDFVTRTGFDYASDLNSLTVSFHRTGTYVLARGRFDWKMLKDYAAQQGGICHNVYCVMPGSTEERRISFCPLRPDIMALAVAPDADAARNLSRRAGGPAPVDVKDPVWAVVPVAALRNGSRMPAGTRMFTSALEGADRVVLSLGPEGSRMRLRADVTCRSQADATSLTQQLRNATTQLRDLIAREKQQPNPADLSGLLAAGTFQENGAHVIGAWPVQPQLLESLAGGSL